jgi:hypothetical protein
MTYIVAVDIVNYIKLTAKARQVLNELLVS